MLETNETNNTELIQEVINEAPEKSQNIQEETIPKKSKNASIKENNDPIVEKDPFEELKLIKEKIKNENKKIQEIDFKLDELRSNAQKKPSFKNQNQSYSLSYQNQENDNKPKDKIVKNKPNILTDINASKSDRSLVVDENSIVSTRKKIYNLQKMNKDPIEEENYYLLEKKAMQQEKEKKYKLLREKELEIVKERKKLISQMSPIGGAPPSTIPVNKKNM